MRQSIYILIGVLLVLAPLKAGTYTFQTDPGLVVGSASVNAQVTFTVGDGSLTAVIKNLLANPTTDAQGVSGLQFTVSEPSLTVTTLDSFSEEITVNSNGTFSVPAAINPTQWINWTYDTGVVAVPSGSTGFRICDVGCGANSPVQVLLGPPDPNGPTSGSYPDGSVYTHANSSIAGSSAHNPFLYESATFTLTVAGLTSAATIGNVVFNFGTAYTTGSTTTTQTQQETTPEPDTVALLGAGVLLVGIGVMRKRKPRK